MAHAMAQPNFIQQVKFKTFSKYDFVESFVSATKDEKTKPEEKIKAAIIADAIEETQAVLLENLATKDDLKALEIATKMDLKVVKEELKMDLKVVKEELKMDIKMLEISMKKEIQSLLIKLAFGFITLVIIPICVAVAIAYTKHLLG